MVDGDDTQDAAESAVDRVLVRPYIQQADEYRLPEGGGVVDPPTTELPTVADSGAGSRARSEPAVVPMPRTQEVPDRVAEERERRAVLWMVGAGLVLSLAAAGLVVAIWPRHHDDPGPVGMASGAPVLPAVGADSPAAAPATARSAPSAASSSSPLPSRSPSRSSSPSAATSAPPASTTLAPPAGDRVGAITGSGGHCLDVKGGIVLFGSELSVYDCGGGTSQQWTVASDGTLRSTGQCATAGGDDTVQLSACGSADSQQWRARSSGTLLNVGTGKCLSDPSNGAKTGLSMRLAECGGSGQQWSLP